MDAPLAVLGRRCFVNGCRSVYRVQKVSVPRACKLVVKGISPSFDEGDWKTCAPLRSSGRRVFCDQKRPRRVPHGRRRRSFWQSPPLALAALCGVGTILTAMAAIWLMLRWLKGAGVGERAQRRDTARTARLRGDTRSGEAAFAKSWRGRVTRPFVMRAGAD